MEVEIKYDMEKGNTDSKLGSSIRETNACKYTYLQSISLQHDNDVIFYSDDKYLFRIEQYLRVVNR